MRVKNYHLVALIVAVAGALGLTLSVGVSLWEVTRASERSARASRELHQAQALLSDSQEWLFVTDSLAAGSPGISQIVDRLYGRCRDDVADLRFSTFGHATDLIDEIEQTLEAIGKAAGELATSDDSNGSKAEALRRFNALSEVYLGQLEELQRLANGFANQQANDFERRLFRTFWVSMVIAILYLGFVALGHIWTTKNLVEPIQELAGAAKWAMEENAAFVLSERGPREVRTLTQTVASFVNSLEEKVRQRTAELEDEVVHRQRAEATVAKANGDLAAKNGDLVAARDEALKGARLKSEFLANMSHEVRTPMNVIIGMTELTLETELQPQQKRQLQMVKDSAESLLRIINDILDFSKIESGKLDLEDVEFNLVESLRDGTHIFSQRAHQKGIDLRCRMQPDVPEVVVGDPGRVRQVITNLVGNAVKFTDEGAVVVAAELEEQNAANVVLHCSVSDSGIGIPKDKHGMIFGDFTQADGSTTRRFGGTGLGLAITRHLVELMGGANLGRK